MSNNNRLHQTREKRQFLNQASKVSLLHRIDVMWMLGTASTIVFLLACAGIVIWQGDLRGYFDPEIVEPIIDERKLTNVYDDIPEEIFLDAVYHTDNYVYISQTNGDIHRFDPLTRLWDTEYPVSDTDVIGTDLTLLRSGCGIAHDSNLLDWLGDCGDPDSLWAVESNGGLLRRINGEWEVVVSTTRFEGRDGQPVQHEELTSAAVSNDNDYLLLGTRANGLGLYHIEQREWIPIAQNQALPQEIEQIVAWEGYFWVVSPQQLMRLTVDGGRVRSQVIDSINGTILDLDADDSLWIMLEKTCSGEGERCLWFGLFDDPDNDPIAVIDQQNHYPELNLNRLHFAQQVDDRLTVAGEKGIYTYNVASHSWLKSFADTVELVLPFQDERGFYFTSNTGVGMALDGRLQSLNKDINEPIVHLSYENPQNTANLLALTENGHLYRISFSGEPTRRLFESQVTEHDPALFTLVVDLGDTLFFSGPEGALIHNVQTRAYQTVPGDDLPSWASRPETVTYRIGNQIFVIAPPADDGRVGVYRVAVSDMASPQFIDEKGLLLADKILLPEGELLDSWRWGDVGIGVKIDEQIYFVDDQLVLAAGSLAPSTLTTVRDVADREFDLVVALEKELLLYDAATRAWNSLGEPNFETPNATIAEMATIDDELFLRSSDGRLTAADGSSKIGSLQPFSIPDNALSDGLVVGTNLYLAGNGRVDLYNLSQRKIIQSWRSNQIGTTSLIAIANDIPVYTTNNQLFWGDDRLSTGDGLVLSTSADNNFIWAMRQTESHRYLQGYPRNNPANQNNQKCYFRQPTAVGTQVFDARQIDADTIAVATDQGVRLYNTQNRSWYSLPVSSGFIPNRLYRASTLLVLVDEANGRFAMAPINQIDVPHSCGTENASWNVRDLQPFVDLSVNESTGQIAWIKPDGSVESWQDGRTTTNLRNTIQPDTTTFQNFFDRTAQGYLLFTRDNIIFHYDLAQQYWRTISVRTESGQIPFNLNIEWTGEKNVVSAVDGLGSLYLGDLGADATQLELETIFEVPPQSESFNASGRQILDVQQRGDDRKIWTFVLDTGVKYYDSEARSWQNGPLFVPDQTFEFVRADERGVLRGNNGQRWYVARDTGNHPTDFVAYDLTPSDQTEMIDKDGLIWRLLFNGAVQRCAPNGAAYQCQTYDEPLILNPDQFNHAFEWRGRVILSGNSLVVIDPDTVSRVPVSQPGLPVGDVTASTIVDNQALLYSQSAERITMLDANFNVEQFNDVTQLRFDRDRRAWIERNGSWFYFANGWQPVTNGLSVYFPHAESPTGIDTNGRLYLWQDQAFGPTDQFLSGIDDSEIDFILEDNGEWWVLAGDNFLHIITSTIATQQLIPISPIMTGEATPQGVAFVDERGERIDIETNLSGPYTVTQSIDLSLLPELPSINRWTQISPRIQALANGDFAYDPITELVVSNGRIFTFRDASGQSDAIAEAGGDVNSFRRAPSLDVTWLRWDRTAQSFAVSAGNGSQAISRADFETDGRLLFETAIAMFEQDGIYVANESGIWRYGSRSLALNDPTIRYYPRELGASRAIKSRFLAGSRQLALSNGFGLNAIQNSSSRIDDVTIEENLLAQTIEVSLLRNNRSVQAQTDRGFLWDRGRRGVAWDGAELVLLTDGGIYYANQLAGFDSGPSANLSQINLDGNGLGDIYVDTGGNWAIWDRPSWQLGVNNPHTNRLMIDNELWHWDIQQGVVDVDLKGSNYQYQFAVSPLRFTFDQMRSGGAVNGQLVIATDAFVELGTENVGYIDQLQAPRSSVLQTDLFFTARLDPNRLGASLFNQVGSNLSIWDGVQFVPYLNDDPRQTRPLIEGNRLRMKLESGQVIKEALREDVNDNSFWSEFQFVNGRFPFDLVYTVSSAGGQLLVGTESGLQIYPDGVIGEFDQLPIFYDLEAAVTRVGRPESDPSRLVILTRRGCFTWQPGIDPAECETPIPLTERIRVSNQFWHWTVSSNNVASGRYRLQDRRLSSQSIRLDGGRFPHDQIADVVVCDDIAYTIWDDDWISQHGTLTLQIDDGIVNAYRAEQAPSQLICIDQMVLLPDSKRLEAGIYYASDENEVFQGQGAVWQPIDETLVDPFLAYANNPPEWHSGRLQVQDNGEEGTFIFERRNLSNEWLPLPWVENERLSGWQVELDRWHNFISLEGQLWAATESGLATVTLRNNRMRIAPNSLVVVSHPTPVCRITDIAQDTNIEDGKNIDLRCQADSDQVYRGHLNVEKDENVFAGQDEDPFVEMVLVSNPLWEWSVIERAQGSLGQLDAVRSNETVGLSDGVFDFDTINSASLFLTDTIELGTDRDGWFQIPRHSADLAGYDRSSSVREPESVQQVSLTRSDEQLYLCLHREGGFERVGISGESEFPPTCPHYLGHDSLWQYGLDTSVMTATLPMNALRAIGGSSGRILKDGRFTDDIVIGAPLPYQPVDQPLKYYLPTVAGIFELDSEFLPAAIHAPPFADLQVLAIPRSLLLFNGLPAFAGKQGLFYLDGREKIEAIEMPESEAVYKTIEYAHDDYMVFEDSGGWTLVNHINNVVVRNTMPVDSATEFEIFEQNRAEWTAQAEPSLLLQFQEVAYSPSITVSFGSNTPLDSPYLNDYTLIQPILLDEELLLIGREKLLKLDLPLVMADAFPEDGQVQPPLVNEYTPAFGNLVPEPPAGYRACFSFVDDELARYTAEKKLRYLSLFTVVLSQTYLQTGEGGTAQAEAAVFYAEQAYRFSRELGTPNPEIELQLLGFLISNYVQLDLLGSAEAAIGVAKELAETLDSEDGKAPLNRFEVIIPLSRGKLDDVERLSLEAIEIYEASGDFKEEANTRQLLAQIYFEIARFEEALRQSQQFVAVETELKEQVGTREQDISWFHANLHLLSSYSNLAQFDAANEIVETVLEPNIHLLTADLENQSEIEHVSLAAIYTGMANAIAFSESKDGQDQFVRAQETLSKGIELVEGVYDSYQVANTSDATPENPCETALSIRLNDELLQLQLANVYLSQGRFYMAQKAPDLARAQQSFETALSYADGVDRFRDLTSAIHLEIANAHLGSENGDLNIARDSAIRADDAYLAFGSAALGTIKEDVDGDVDGAIALYKKGIQGWEDARENLRVESFQIDIADLSTDMYARLISLLIEQAEQEGDARLLEEAFDYAERAKARAFLDQFAQASSLDVAGEDPELSLLLNELRDLEIELLDTSRGSANISDLEQKLSQLINEIAVFNPEIASMVAVVPPSFAEIQQAVPKDVTLLQYFITDNETWVFVINGPNQPLQVVPLGVDRETLIRSSGDMYEFGSVEGDQAGFSIEQEKAYDIFVSPLKDYISHKKLIIVPHLTLHRMPWYALKDPATQAFFGEQYLLTFLPSSSTLTYLAAAPAKQETQRNLVVGVAEVPYDDDSPTIQNAVSEASRIATLLDTSPLVGPQATEETVKELAERSRILHISAHGEYNANQPMLSNIKLADEPLEIYDIHNLDLETYTDLVVLSACQAGFGTVRDSDDLISLNRAFLQAGAPNVVSTLWIVQQDTTEKFMIYFYTMVDQGHSYAEALQLAQKHMREDPDTADPHHWAGFILTGAHEPRIDQVVLNFIDDNLMFVLFIFFMVVVVVMLSLIIRSRRRYE